MDSKNLLKKYYSRLAKESFIKSLICGLIVGFSVLLISAAVCLVVGFKGIWLCVVLFLVATAGITPILYYRLFRPTIKQAAKRADALGLEERLLTMTELEGDTSFIAKKQRGDATAALNRVNEKLIKLAISIPLIVTLAIVALCGTGMTVFAALPEAPVKLKKFVITYEMQGEGSIEGDILPIEGDDPKIEIDGETFLLEGDYYQIVEEGKNANAVIAVPEDEWVFAGWTDGYGNPYRLDIEISKHVKIYVVFEEMPDPEDPDPEETEPEYGEGEADPGAPTEKDPDDTQPSPDPGEGNGGGEGGAYEDHNQVIDGKTYYGDSTYDNAYNDAMDYLTQNSDIPEELKAIIEDYYDTIAK